MPAKLLLIALAVAFAGAGTAGAHGPYSVSKGAIAAGSAEPAGDPSGVTGCQQHTWHALSCDGGGVGAEVYLSRDADPVTDAPLECGLKQTGVIQPSCVWHTQHHHHPFATGSCEVLTSTPGTGSDFTFTCGVDRNNDGVLTDADVCQDQDDPVTGAHLAGEEDGGLGPLSHHDECTGETAVKGWNAEDHSDDWVSGDQDSGPVPFCFQDNVRGFTDPFDDTGEDNHDVSAVNQRVFPVEHGDGWDRVLVFVGPAGTNPFSGAVMVTLTVSGAPSCDGGGNVSGHATPGNAETDTLRDSTQCMDSIDNDGDGAIDEADGHCLNGSSGAYTPLHDDESA